MVLTFILIAWMGLTDVCTEMEKKVYVWAKCEDQAATPNSCKAYVKPDRSYSHKSSCDSLCKSLGFICFKAYDDVSMTMNPAECKNRGTNFTCSSKNNDFICGCRAGQWKWISSKYFASSTVATLVTLIRAAILSAVHFHQNRKRGNSRIVVSNSHT